MGDDANAEEANAMVRGGNDERLAATVYALRTR